MPTSQFLVTDSEFRALLRSLVGDALLAATGTPRKSIGSRDLLSTAPNAETPNCRTTETIRVLKITNLHKPYRAILHLCSTKTYRLRFSLHHVCEVPILPSVSKSKCMPQ